MTDITLHPRLDKLGAYVCREGQMLAEIVWREEPGAYVAIVFGREEALEETFETEAEAFVAVQQVMRREG